MTPRSRPLPWVRRGAAPALLALLLAAAPGGAAASEEAAADAALRARIEAGLASLPQATAATLRVAVRDGNVVLSGRVALLEHSLRAEQVTWRTPGVVDVDNQLRVAAAGAPDDGAIERAIRLIIKDGGDFLDTHLRLEVDAGAVRLAGLFQDPADVLALKHRIASIPGVVAVSIEARLVARGATPAGAHT